jgi:hypothetical protein
MAGLEHVYPAAETEALLMSLSATQKSATRAVRAALDKEGS